MNNNEFIKLFKNFSIPNLALYVHIPFCKSKCSYCDFYSVAKSSAKAYLDIADNKTQNTKFTKKLLDDILDLSELFSVKNFSSIYLGGGTPSVLSSEDIFYLSSNLSVKQNPKREFTIELNPESVSTSFIEASIAGGINRFSLGVQTFSESILQSQNRPSTKKEIETAIRILQDAEKKYSIKVSCDLIVGFENQTKEEVLYNVQSLIDADIKHISVYTLCTKNYTNDKENDLANDLFDIVEKKLLTAGFVRYEVSNFAKAKEYESEHNKSYWHLENYFGVGPSAVGNIIFGKDKKDVSSFAIRTTGFKNINGWYKNKFPYMIEKISLKDSIKDFLLMGLRLSEGIDKNKFFDLFGIDFDNLLPKTILKYKDFIFINTENKFSLNEKGLNFLTEVLVFAFLEIENYKKL